MNNVFWIYFLYNGDLIGGRVEGKTAQVYWNNKKVGDKGLQKEYSASEFNRLHPMQIQNDMFQVIGFEAFNVQDLTIHEGDLDWQELLKQKRG